MTREEALARIEFRVRSDCPESNGDNIGECDGCWRYPCNDMKAVGFLAQAIPHEKWEYIKEHITEMRDADGESHLNQKQICQFILNLMGVIEEEGDTDQWCKFKSEKNCGFCAFHSECKIHWKEGDEECD